MKRTKSLLYLIIILTFSLHLDAIEFEIKTFGTIGAVYNDNETQIFRKDISQKDGSSNDINFKTDSLLGVQTTIEIDEKLSFTLQGVGAYDYNDEINAKIDWGYLKYAINENISIQLGRLRTPYYKNSQNLNVGYSNLMIRESVEVYGQVPFSSYNGLQLTYMDIIGRYFYELQAGYGREELVVPFHSINEKIDVDIKNLYTANFTFGTPAIQARATYLRADITATNDTLNQLFDGIRLLNPTLANSYEFKDKKSEYIGFGIFIDYNNFIFSSEYGQRRINCFFADLHGYYATLGYSFDKFIPFITYAKTEMDKPTYEADTGVVSLDYILHTQNLAQSSKTLGVKYYINDNLDFKFQYEYVVPDGEYGSYHLNTSTNPKSMNVLSMALDFVF